MVSHSLWDDASTGILRALHAVTWTLEHEVIFYLLAAVVVPVLGRMWLAAILTVLASVASFFKPQFGDIQLFTLVHADFLVGILAYDYRARLRRIGAFAPLLCSPFLYWLGNRGYMLAVPAGSFLAVVGFVNASWEWNRWPLRGAVILGDASYSIYLSHWIFLYLSNRLAWGIQVEQSAAEFWRYICGLSVLLWYGFERPINNIGHQLSRSGGGGRAYKDIVPEPERRVAWEFWIAGTPHECFVNALFNRC